MVDIALLRAFPDPAHLRHRSRVLAMLDCIFDGMPHTHPVRTYRYAEF